MIQTLTGLYLEDNQIVDQRAQGFVEALQENKLWREV
jgi:hypothetical protein